MPISPYLSPTRAQRLLSECIRDDFPARKTEELKSALSAQRSFYDTLPNFWQPCLYSRLKTSLPAVKDSPDHFTDQLREAYLYNALKNAYFCEAAVDISRAFHNAGVPLAFFKGIALMNTVYGDAAARTMMDADFCVNREDVDRAGEILLGIGFAAVKLISDERSFHHIYARGQLSAELHWNVDRAINGAIFKKMLERRRAIMISGEPFDIFAPEEEIFAACLNFDRTFFLSARPSGLSRNIAAYRGLFFLYELKNIIRFYQNGLDWDRLISLAASAGRGFEIFSSILLAEKVAGAPVPPRVLRKIRNDIFMRLYSFLARRQAAGDFIDLFAVRNIIMTARFSRYKKVPIESARKVNAAFMMYLYFYHNVAYRVILKARGRK